MKENSSVDSVGMFVRESSCVCYKLIASIVIWNRLCIDLLWDWMI